MEQLGEIARTVAEIQSERTASSKADPPLQRVERLEKLVSGALAAAVQRNLSLESEVQKLRRNHNA